MQISYISFSFNLLKIIIKKQVEHRRKQVKTNEEIILPILAQLKTTGLLILNFTDWSKLLKKQKKSSVETE